MRREHIAGITISAVLHGAVIASLWIGMRGDVSSSQPENGPTSLSLAMFKSGYADQKPSETSPPVEKVAEKAAEPVLTPRPDLKKKPTEKKSIEKKPAKSQVQEPLPVAEKPDTAEAVTTEQKIEPEQEKTAELNENRDTHIATSHTAHASVTADSINPATDHGLVETLETAYLQALRMAIDARKYYPKRARRMKREGEVIVEFIISRDGTVSGVAISRTSGTDILDTAAAEAVKQLGRFKPIPEPINRDQWKMSIPINFALM